MTQARRAVVIPLLALLAALQGCSIIYKTTGDILVGYGRSEMTPFLLQMDDVDMACATGASFTPFLTSFQRVHSHPQRLAVLTYSVAAGCAQQQALEQRITYRRASREGRAAAAQDARTREKRYSRLAAERLMKSWRYVTETYPGLTEDRCPRLRTEFDELVFMIGWLSGIQAMQYDTVAGGQVGVPRSIIGNARHAAACLDSARWWGVPRAMRASVEVILPALAPDGAEPWKRLETAVDTGFEQGVRLSSALYVIAAYSVNKEARMRQGIRDYAAYEDPVNGAYAMLDAVAGFMIRGISDELWVRETGRRTPFGSLGRFPGDEREAPSVNIDDLL